jgi:hypothetical protein
MPVKQQVFEYYFHRVGILRPIRSLLYMRTSNLHIQPLTVERSKIEIDTIPAPRPFVLLLFIVTYSLHFKQREYKIPCALLQCSVLDIQIVLSSVEEKGEG